MIWARTRAWLRGIVRRSRFEGEMAAELRFHMDSYEDDLVRSGVAREEARRRARLEFGPVETQKDECRAALGVRLADDLSADVRYAVRMMRKTPGFTLVAVATLALGIGANTAIFTLMDAILLRLMPVHDPGRLYQVRRVQPSGPTRLDGAFTNPLWENLSARQDVFSSIGAWGTRPFNLARGGAIQEAKGIWVSGSYFGTLEIAPAAGRLIGSADDYRGCPGVAVLSHAFWRARYGGAGDTIGRTISLDSEPFEIVGVAAEGFYGSDVGQAFDVALPMCATAKFTDKRRWLDGRSTWWLSVIGRLRPGLTPQQANAQLAAVSPQITAAAVPDNWDVNYKKPFLQATFVAAPAAAGVADDLRSNFQRPLGILMALVAVVLLIACANVASLLLARGAAQARETGVRLALGAGRGRLIRQFLTHALLLSAAGAATGLLLAHWGTALLVGAISTRRQQIFLDLSPDWRVAGFTAAIALVTGIVFGTLPAIRTTRVPLTGAMRGPGAGPQQEGRGGARAWIVAGQMALSLVLIVTAGLCLRSFMKLARLDTGFDRQHALLVTADLRATGIPVDRYLSTFDAIEARLGTVAGVIAVGRSYVVPLGGGGWNDTVRADAQGVPQGHDGESLMNFVSPGYFAAMRITLVAGRGFGAADGSTAPRVAIVNQAFIRKFFGSIAPIGQDIHVVDTSGKAGSPIQIVGVVSDAKYMRLRETMQATAFFPIAQIPETGFANTFAIRTAARPEASTAAVEAAVGAVSRDVPLRFTTLARVVDDAMVRERLLALLSAFFGGMALLLAMIGLYGTISYRVALRRPEFGIRRALGAPPGSIVRLVIREVTAVLIVGTAAGVALCLVTTSALQTLLFGLGPRDAGTIAGAALLLSIVALAAAYLPARRAARVEPMTALRCE
jgi:putative ABC transport system permease protein